MPSSSRLAQKVCAVVLASFLAVASSRPILGQPSVREAAKRWRERLPSGIEQLRGQGLARAEETWMEQHGGVPPWRRGRAGGKLATLPAPALAQRFHAGGLATAEPDPLNALLDPLGLFEGEAGEEPPAGPQPRVFFADFDGDQDLDVFVGDKYGYVRYLRNDAGPGVDPVYTELTGAASPTGSLDLSFDDADMMDTTPYGPSAPALADLDGDEDLDLFVGQGYYDGAGTGGRVLYFENDGTGTLTRNDAANPFDGFLFGLGFATPTFVDIDEDDDLDAFVGTKVASASPVGEVYFLRNDGTENAPLFVDRTEVAGEDPFAGVPWEPLTAPYFADLDGDDDLDAFVGAGYKIRHFRNDTVLPGPPAFLEQTGYDNPMAGFDVFPGPALADVDGDGDLDAFVGLGYGKEYGIGFVQYFENTGNATDPGLLTPGDRLELVDVDGDGDLDALASRYSYSSLETSPTGGAVHADGLATRAAGAPAGPFVVEYFRNDGTETEPSWQRQSGLDNPFCTFNTGYSYTGSSYSFPSVAPTVGHLDGDELLDGFVGLPDGNLEFLEDDGTGQLDPAATHPLESVDFENAPDPHLADLDGDGELDLVVGHEVYDPGSGSYESRVSIFLNPTGPAGLDAPADLVLDLGQQILRPAPTVADVDGDGDPDLFVGGYVESFVGGGALTLFIENQGTEESPSFDPASTTPVEVLVDNTTSPALGDVNGDGGLDLFLGNLSGAEMFVTHLPRLEVTKQVTGGDLEVGGTVEYTIVVTNVGAGPQPDDPDDAELTDVLPPELSPISATVTAGPGSVSLAGATLRYDGALEAGEAATIVVEAAIVTSAGTIVENQAFAFYDGNADGENDTEEPSDDPTTAEDDDPTRFQVAAPTSPLEIPTLSQWASMLFAGFLSLLGLFGIRRFGG